MTRAERAARQGERYRVHFEQIRDLPFMSDAKAEVLIARLHQVQRELLRVGECIARAEKPEAARSYHDLRKSLNVQLQSVQRALGILPPPIARGA